MDQPGTRDFVAPFILAYTYKRTTGPVLGRFLGALGEGVILGARTRDGEVVVPASEFDPRTGHATSELVPVGPLGTIETWSLVSEPRPSDPLAEPFAWALVRLDGAATAMLHVVRAGATPITTGARVRPVFSEQPEGSVRDLVAFEVIP